MNEVIQIIESNKNAGSGTGIESPPTIQLEISQTSGLNNLGDTLYYDNNKMKVTKMANVTVSGGTVNFDFFIHSLPNGGKFTLNKDIKYDDGGTAQLDGVDADLQNVSEVYYYENNTKGALKVKAMDGEKIFYSTAINQNSTWTNQATKAVPGTQSELQTLVNKIKDQVEIKLDKD